MSNGLSEDPPGRRGEKSASAFRTISEVASELNVPSHVLRFWETKFSQVRPLKRGGGRRYYRPEDVSLLRGIRSLLYDDGYTIKGVQKLLRDSGGKLPADDSRPASPAPAATAEPVRAQETSAALTEVLRELETLRDLLRKG